MHFARLLAVLATEVLEAWKKVENQARASPHPSHVLVATVTVRHFAVDSTGRRGATRCSHFPASTDFASLCSALLKPAVT